MTHQAIKTLYFDLHSFTTPFIFKKNIGFWIFNLTMIGQMAQVVKCLLLVRGSYLEPIKSPHTWASQRGQGGCAHPLDFHTWYKYSKEA